MNYIGIACFILITIWIFINKPEYALAVFLVGQPIYKLMIVPFSKEYATKYVLIYILVGTVAYGIKNRKSIKTSILEKKLISRFWIIGIFILGLAITTFWSTNKVASLQKVKDLSFIIITILILAIIALREVDDIYKLIDAIANISLIIALITLGKIYIDQGVFTARVPGVKICGIDLVTSIWYGRRTGIALLGLIVLIKRRPNLWNISRLALLAICTLLSFSRGPILFLLLTILIVYGLNRRNLDKKYIFRYGIIASVILIITLGIIFAFHLGKVGSRLFDFTDQNVVVRLELYKNALLTFKDHIFGIGIGNFRSIGVRYNYPHNMILELAAETGLIGLGIFTVMIVKSVRGLLQLVRKCKENGSREEDMLIISYSISIFIFALLNAQVSGDLKANEYVWFSIVLIYIIEYIVKYKEQVSL